MGCNDECKYQRNSVLSFKRKRTAWNQRKDKTMTLDTQVNLAKSDKGSFYNQKGWLEEYKYGKGMFYSEHSDDLWTSASVFLHKFANVLVKYFSMSIRSTKQLFLERPLYRCFLHNDHLPYFQ